MSWKNYFYFDKQDKIAIAILFTLIVIAGGIYVLVSNKAEHSSVPPKTEKELQAFQAQLTEKETAYHSNEKRESERNYSNYPYQQKLEVGATIEINTADTTSLKMLPGIGSSFASRIVKYRNLLGGYYTKNQLKEVYGVDEDLYKKINPYITIIPKTQKLNANTADFKELLRHPYISYEQVKVITDIRSRKSKIESINRLELLEEFTADDIQRLTPYLSFD